MGKRSCVGQMNLFSFLDQSNKVIKTICDIPAEYVYSVLKMNTTFEGGKERIAKFLSENPREINKAMRLLKQEYGVGGCGWLQKEDGICGYSHDGSYLHINYMENGSKKNGKLPYNIVACEIRTLIQKGEYL